VIAFNSNKATFKTGDKGYLQFAVLDDNGSTLCDTDLSATIIAPNGKKTKLSTSKGQIIKNPECKPNNVMDSPDYYAYYNVDKAGDYKIEITANTANGERKIIDGFFAQKENVFDVERSGRPGSIRWRIIR
jgi:hypothetical protein